MVWARHPAMVIGLDAPNCAKVLTMQGMSARTASTRTREASGANCIGGATWLMLSERNGLHLNASADPASMAHMLAMSATWTGCDALTITCLVVPASEA